MGQPTREGIPPRIHTGGRRTRGTETSQYPEEQKSTEIPSVAASERGTATGSYPSRQENGLERPAAAGDSPVSEGARARLGPGQVGRGT